MAAAGLISGQNRAFAGRITWPGSACRANGTEDSEERHVEIEGFLERFVKAQDRVWDSVLAELEDGRKTSHWMWFVFPQIAGLGRSATAQHFALPSLAAAGSYLAHPVLGPRLHAALAHLMRHRNRQVEDILGSIDSMKLRSSLTLFRAAAPEDPAFQDALDAFFGGKPDQRTLDLLET